MACHNNPQIKQFAHKLSCDIVCLEVSIDAKQKAELLAKLNDIDKDESRSEEKEIANRFQISSVGPSEKEHLIFNNNNIAESEKKSNLLEQLFGSGVNGKYGSKNSYQYTSSGYVKPLKTSLKTSPSILTKTVKFLEDQDETDINRQEQ